MKEKTKKMVAISLYRGNLHRTPDVPRRWLMPNPKISLKDFKSLLARRSKALSNSNPNPNPNPNPNLLSNGEGPSTTNQKDDNQPQLVDDEPELVDSKKNELDGFDLVTDFKNDDDDDDDDDALEKASDGDGDGDGGDTSGEKQTDDIIGNEDLLNDKEQRKKEVEDKLQVLNAKKHNLVLVLKQILNAEEELKRRNGVQQQAVVMRSNSVPLKMDGTNDTGSVTRLTTRLGSEGNLVGDVDGGEADDFTNHNMQHSQLVLRTSSMSPSSESPLTRTPSVQHNMVSNPSRASFAAAGSPSPRLAHSGQQGNPMNLPSVSVSGTSYIASSPSPAASGGTSVFRDSRDPSPWK